MFDCADWQKENREKREQQDDKQPLSPPASPKKPPSSPIKPRIPRSPSPSGIFGLAAAAGKNGTPVGACSPNSHQVDANNQETAKQAVARKSKTVIPQKVLQDQADLENRTDEFNQKMQEAA